MLSSAVLVLNRRYQPVRVTNARRALSMLYVGLAKAVTPTYQTFDFSEWATLSAELGAGAGDVVRTTRHALLIPRVILLAVYDKLPVHRVRFSRNNIYLRDGDTCQYCRRRLQRHRLNLDHVVPRTLGGQTTWENVVCACVECNLKKGGRTPRQAGLRLLKRPVEPDWRSIYRIVARPERFDDWRPFLNAVDASYWNTTLDEG